MKRYILFTCFVGLGLILLLGFQQFVPAQPPPNNFIPPQDDFQVPDNAGIQELAQGPLHEAFAQPTDFEPGPGPDVPKKPPEPIPETPPEQRPEGDNVEWIPGYWSWDAERQDFVWISGVYRKMPPNQQFVPGYWDFDGQNWHWVSGFWTSNQNQDLTYVPQPPVTKDQGPMLPPVEENSVYSPGYWYHANDGFFWQSGSWVPYLPHLVWIPPHYHWTPCGFVLAGGYWDYPPEDRGLVFAPVYFTQPYWNNPDWFYQPRSIIDIGLVMDSFFVGPHHRHYYFGDYYHPRYVGRGFSAWFAFGSGRYDPLYHHYHHKHRNNPQWHNHMQTVYNDRMAGKHPVPPRMINQQNFNMKNIVNNNVNVKNQLRMVSLKNQSVKNMPRLEKVSEGNWQKQKQFSQKVFAAQKNRKDVENQIAKTEGGPGKGGKPGKLNRPVNVDMGKFDLPKAPVFAKPDPGKQPGKKFDLPPTPKLPGVGSGKGKGQPPKIDPPKVQPPNVQPPKVQPPGKPPKIEPPVVQPPKVQPPGKPPKVDPPNVQPPKVQPPGQPPKVQPPGKPPKVEPPVVQPPKVQPPGKPPKVEPPKVQPPVQPPKVQPPKVQPPVQPPKVQPPKVQPPKVQPPVQPPKVQPPKVQPPVQPPKVQPPKVQPPKKGKGSEALFNNPPVSQPPRVQQPVQQPAPKVQPPKVQQPAPKVQQPVYSPPKVNTPPRVQQPVNNPPAPKKTYSPPPQPKSQPPRVNPAPSRPPSPPTINKGNPNKGGGSSKGKKGR